jgi:hypothetical protein
MDLVYVGKVVNTHGIKGELRIISDFEKKELVFKVGNKIIIDSDEHTIRTYRFHIIFDMITIDELDNINDVLCFVGKNVYVSRDSLKLKSSDYLLSDLIDELDLICENWYIYEDNLTSRCVEIIKEWVDKKESDKSYGTDFDYRQAMNEVVLSMNFCKMFDLNRKEVYANQSKVLSFGMARFKKDLRVVIDKVIMKRMTLFELKNINLDDEEGPKKVLRP